jgi:hypothetical protein
LLKVALNTITHKGYCYFQFISFFIKSNISDKLWRVSGYLGETFYWMVTQWIHCQRWIYSTRWLARAWTSSTV